MISRIRFIQKKRGIHKEIGIVSLDLSKETVGAEFYLAFILYIQTVCKNLRFSGEL